MGDWVGDILNDVTFGLVDSPTEEKTKQAQQAADNQLSLQREIFDYQKKLNEPFYEQGLPAFYQLVSGITGKPVAYNAPTLSSSSPGSKTMVKPMSNGTTITWQPQESEGFKYVKNRTLEDLGRQLQMMGRGTGTVAANTTARTISDLNANNEEKQLARLADLVNIGRGGASSLATAAAGYGNNAGETMTNSALAQMLIKNNASNQMYQGLGQIGGGLARYYGSQGGGGGDLYGGLNSSGGYNSNPPVTGDTYFPNTGYQYGG